MIPLRLAAIRAQLSESKGFTYSIIVSKEQKRKNSSVDLQVVKDFSKKARNNGWSVCISYDYEIIHIEPQSFHRPSPADLAKIDINVRF